MLEVFHAVFDTGSSSISAERLSSWTLEPVMKDRASGSRVEYITLAWVIDVFPPLIRAAERASPQFFQVRTNGVRPSGLRGRGRCQRRMACGIISSYLHSQGTGHRTRFPAPCLTSTWNRMIRPSSPSSDLPTHHTFCLCRLNAASSACNLG